MIDVTGFRTLLQRDELVAQTQVRSLVIMIHECPGRRPGGVTRREARFGSNIRT
jgi:hypothetical protein